MSLWDGQKERKLEERKFVLKNLKARYTQPASTGWKQCCQAIGRPVTIRSDTTLQNNINIALHVICEYYLNWKLHICGDQLNQGFGITNLRGCEYQPDWINSMYKGIAIGVSLLILRSSVIFSNWCQRGPRSPGRGRARRRERSWWRCWRRRWQETSRSSRQMTYFCGLRRVRVGMGKSVPRISYFFEGTLCRWSI